MTNYTVYRISKAGTRKELGIVELKEDPRSQLVIDTLVGRAYLTAPLCAEVLHVDFGTTDRIGIEDPDCRVVVELLAIRAPMSDADVSRIAEAWQEVLPAPDNPSWLGLTNAGRAYRCNDVREVLAALSAAGFKVVAK